MPNVWPGALPPAAIVPFAAAGWVAARRRPASPESLLPQLPVLLPGPGATLLAGYRSLHAAVKESARRQARSAFRRVTALCAGYTRTGPVLPAGGGWARRRTRRDGYPSNRPAPAWTCWRLG